MEELKKNIVLAGFMGTGKTTVGKIIAKRLGFAFCDMDAIIEKEAGRTIPEIFRDCGEAHFRALEKSLCQRLAQGEKQVIATGGGVVKDAANVAVFRENGVIVRLLASPETIFERTAGDANRPLLDKGDAAAKKAEIMRLLAEREPLYRAAADYAVETDGKAPREVAALVMEAAGVNLPEYFRKVTVRTAAKTYDIVIGAGVLSLLPEFLKQQKYSRKALIITDSNVGPLYAETVRDLLETAGLAAEIFTITAGEESKSLATLEKILEAAADFGLDRKSAIFALGGGVVGDLAGYAAASFMRGVPFVQLPTSLLADVDSSVGGKTGVNLAAGKNLAGAFYQPDAVFIDTECLKTLPQREISTGLGEIVKYGIISDENMFEYLEENAAAVKALGAAAVSYLVTRSCEIKADIVSHDEKEGGIRRILNFGHTLAHAIERTAGYGQYNHGEAVSIGMVGAAHISRRLGLLAEETFQRIVRLLDLLELPKRADGCDIDEMYAAIFHDKKTFDGVVNWVLAEGLGKVTVRSDVTKDLIYETLNLVRS